MPWMTCALSKLQPHHHKAHKRHVDHRAAAADEDVSGLGAACAGEHSHLQAIRALQDEELRAWEDDQRVRVRGVIC